MTSDKKTTTPAKRDRISQICFAYLRTDHESAKAARFQELAGHCKRHLERLYPANPHQTITSIKENGESDGLPRIITEDSRARSREFVDTWLLLFLLPYRDCSLQVLEKEAEKGTFRFIGKQCRDDLIDLLRAHRKRPEWTLLTRA